MGQSDGAQCNFKRGPRNHRALREDKIHIFKTEWKISELDKKLKPTESRTQQNASLTNIKKAKPK